MKVIHAQEKLLSIESVHLVAEMEKRRLAAWAGVSTEQFAVHIGLSPNQYWKRAAVARVFHRFPESQVMLQAGETCLSHLAMVACKITDANADLLLDGIKNKKRREVEGLLSRVTRDGRLTDAEPEVEIRFRLRESQLALLDRAREVLSHSGKMPALEEVIMQALDAFLEKKDPMRKAERASARKRPSVRAEIKHNIWLRDGGQCTWRYADGGRCSAKAMLELDHIKMWCRGGRHGVDNLTLRCRSHNQFAAERELGLALTSRYGRINGVQAVYRQQRESR